MRRISKWGVIPYRFLKGGGIEVLLITTKSKKWGLPKGNMIRKLGPSPHGYGGSVRGSRHSWKSKQGNDQVHAQEYLPFPLPHVSDKGLFQLARGIKEIQKVGRIV